MKDATLIADLVRAGVDAELINRVALTMSVRGQSADTSADKRRIKDAERKRTAREALKKRQQLEAAQANDGAGKTADDGADASADIADNRCNLSSLLEKDSTAEVSKKKNSKSDCSARGTRMQPDAVIMAEDFTAAEKLGAHPDLIPGMWAEHVDYWIAVPGARGLKLDWPATWRNRVRDVLARGNRNGQRTYKAGTYPAAGPAQNGADAILAGMANVARKRGLLKPANGPQDREFQRPLNLAGRADAD